MGDFGKKIPTSACWKKNIACSTTTIKNYCTALRKKLNVTKLFHHSESFTKTQRNCNHSSLAPFKPDLVMLQNYWFIHAMYYNRHIKKSVAGNQCRFRVACG